MGSPPPVMEKKHFYHAWFPTFDFRKPSKLSKSVNSQNVIGFLWKPPCFTLSAFEVVYPTFHTSHRIGKVLKKYLFSAKIIEEAEHFILSRHFYTFTPVKYWTKKHLKYHLKISTPEIYTNNLKCLPDLKRIWTEETNSN